MQWRRHIGMMLAAVLASGVGGARAQQSEPPGKSAAKQEPAATRAPVAIPADAIGLGAKMAELAPPEFLKWARGYAKRALLRRSAPPADETVQESVEARFPKASLAAREAGVFLLWYEAYQQVSENQQLLGQRIAEMDRDIGDLESDLVRFGTTTPSLGDPARNAQARVERRLDSARRQRRLYKGGLDALHPRMDICLQRLTALYETVKDADPNEVRGLK